jgi:two-component system chemotaxis response regulator CheY
MTEPPINAVYGKYKLLVLEDQPSIRKHVCLMLQRIGFRSISEAADGTEGLKVLLRVKPDLIICDVHMEPMDGINFLTKLRGMGLLGHPEFARVPFIFLTSDLSRDTVLAAKELHVNGYLGKPVTQEDLKLRIDAALKIAPKL